MTVLARLVDGDDVERLTTPFDQIDIRVAGDGDIEVVEYRSEDRDGPPAHRHPWDEIEYVIEGEVEFLVGDGGWQRLGPGGVQVLPAGTAHSVRVPAGAARVLMVTVGPPYAPFARELAALGRDGAEVSGADIVAVAHRHGVALAAEGPTAVSVGPRAVIDAYLAAWQRGAPEDAWACYADDVVMRLPGRSGLAGLHRGRAAVVGAIEALLARTDGTAVEVEPIDVLDSGERVAVVLREVVQRGSDRLELRRTNLYRVRDGRITEIDIFEADQYEVDEFFG
jgi:ketosteroid isomerase-like protein/quercetin dioxygenase-like cupin family protein